MPAPSQAADRAASLVELWRDDPLQAWMDWLPPAEHPREWQPDLLDALRDRRLSRLALAATREAGKSRIEAMWGIHHLVTVPGSTVVLFTPIDRHAGTAFWHEVGLIWKASPVLRKLLPDWKLQSREIVTGDSGRMLSIASDTPSGLEGLHSPNLLAIVDEAQSFPDSHFTSIQGINPARLIACGTGGDDVGWFAAAFGHQKWMWDLTRRITAPEIPRLRPVYGRELKRLGAGNPILRRMWLAEFCSASEYSIFDEQPLKHARGFQPELRTSDEVLFGIVKDGDIVLGVDPARGGPGGDDCAVALLRGRKLERIFTLPPGDEMALAEAIAGEARREHAAAVIVESAGLGHGVYARTRQLLRDSRTCAYDFVGTKKARYDQAAANQKAEVVLRLRTMLLDKTIGLPAGPEFDRLANELMRLRLVTTTDSRVRIADPPVSPDYADAAIAALSYLVYSRIGIASVDVDWI